ncbi:ABC transporter substrate-binding protein (plasmid) [Natrialbaceae archaeon A-arb3/5]
MAYDYSSRRAVLKTTGAVGAAGLAGLAGCLGNGDGEEQIGNYPPEGDSVTFGLNAPQSGLLAPDGIPQFDAFEMAIDHLNNGGGWVDEWDELSGDGVLDYEVEGVDADSGGDGDQSVENIERMIEQDNIQMWTGGVSSGVAEALQPVAQRENVPYMVNLSTSNLITGEHVTRYSFRTAAPTYMLGLACASVLPDELGDDLDFYQIYLDYSFGITGRESMLEGFEDVGWTEVGEQSIPEGEMDYSAHLADAQDSGADVVILSTFGDALTNALEQAADAGITDEMDIIVTTMSNFSLEPASENIEDVYGTTDWTADRGDEYSDIFVEEYESEFGETPGFAPKLVYENVMLYAEAVERAGTFFPPDVVRELEDYEYDHTGVGDAELRECDHQAHRMVPVVRGLSEEDQEETGQFVELVDEAPREDTTYGCDEGPAADADMGEYGDE